MDILHISDWHCTADDAERLVEEHGLSADDPEMLLVTGDMLEDPAFITPDHIRKQRRQWREQVEVFERVWPAAHIVAVPGNHDWCDYAIPKRVTSWDKFETRTQRVNGLLITGFRGVEMFTGRYNGEFSERCLSALVDAFDPQADIVLTHLAPHGFLDVTHDGRFIGHFNLYHWSYKHQEKPRIHAFGHVHECGGQTVTKFGTTFSNAAGYFNRLKLPV